MIEQYNNCCLYHKDTKLKANHNQVDRILYG